MNQSESLAQQFETHRAHLRAVAYKMLGSLSEADDAVQEAWLRLARSDSGGIANLGAWLTTVVARVCLDVLRARRSRREEPLGLHVPDPIVSRADRTDPAHEALLADSVGLALLVVLETLGPAERLAFVLHDTFAVPFDETASIVGRSPSAARQLASRARRRVQGASRAPDADLTCQREVVDAFLTAARGGDFDGLLAVLDPDVVVRADRGAVPPGASWELRGARVVAEQAQTLLGFRMGSCFRSWASRSDAGKSSKSTFSPTLRGSVSSTYRPRQPTPMINMVKLCGGVTIIASSASIASRTMLVVTEQHS